MANQYLSQTQSQKQLQVLAPQLRQSLEMLQVPILELRALIEQELEQNPTLEDQPSEVNTQLEIEPGEGGEEEEKNEEMDFDKDFEKEFEVLKKLDEEWRDYFNQTQPVYKGNNADEEERRQFFLDSLSISQSLQEHLMDQLSYSEFSEEDRRIAEMLIGSINDDGLLAGSIADLAYTTGYPESRLNNMLDKVQEFDPVGVGARDISECLIIQLKRLGLENSIEAEVVKSYLPLLGSRKLPELARVLKLSIEEVNQIADFIGTLEPKPGRAFSSDSTTYVLPEIFIQKVDGEFTVMMNNDHLPNLRISNYYKKMMEDPGSTKEVKEYIRDKVRSGAFLIKSINQRQTTIGNIAKEIVKVQKEFFEEGISKLRPLTMSVVADILEIHETTVSRAIANKYMQTPQGIYEMKFFFTPGFKTEGGEQVSNKTIKDAITTLVNEENDLKPLSDQAMVKALKEQGFSIARRTIAKYREELNILPSHLRKQF